METDDPMSAVNRPIKVAIVGGGCASIATAFELTRPEHKGRYQVTIYQQGWRLGGKGASGRGPNDRIEEHGLHMWLGFYENAFRLLRECYDEHCPSPQSPVQSWSDVFVMEPHVALAGKSDNGEWVKWSALFPPCPGLPGDSFATYNPFTIQNYIGRTLKLIRTLLVDLKTHDVSQTDVSSGDGAHEASGATSAATAFATLSRYAKKGTIVGAAGLVEVIGVLEAMVLNIDLLSNNKLARILGDVARNIRGQVEDVVVQDDDIRLKWEVLDLAIAIGVGMIKYRVLFQENGLDCLDEYECRDWLRENGASERALDSAFIRGLYDLALAYEDGQAEKPGLATGQAIRGALRMFFTYRGQMFWKMRIGMGDAVFAPFHDVLSERGVEFKFFHRLRNVHISGEDELEPGEIPHVKALAFDLQARIKRDQPYQPLRDVAGVPSWPSEPDWSQLEEGDQKKNEGWDFESFWDDRKTESITHHVGADFDLVVLGVGVGEIPHVCREIVQTNRKWADMVANVKTTATQAFQVWLNVDVSDLGWKDSVPTLAGHAKPFDTYAEMAHTIAFEGWQAPPPKTVVYFCGVFPTDPVNGGFDDVSYPARTSLEVKQNAIDYLNSTVCNVWPDCVVDGQFRWDLLVNENSKGASGQKVFDTQYWTCNINPSDRYVLSLPGSLKYRISPLDKSYDNMTIAGDWTDCGFNEGCVEAAVMSGRLAAHAISGAPKLEDIVGYDHL